MQKRSSHLTDDAKAPPFSFATDPIGEINDSLPVHPDLERPSTRDLWKEMIKKQPRKKPPKNKPGIERPGTGGQINDYA